jgi:DNA-binding MarR family transcriptional regulator
MGVEPMTLCGYLDKLQAMGLVDRQQCFADRRAKRIRLTDTSVDMLSAIRYELQQIIASATEGVDDETARQLCGALTTFNSNLQALGSLPAPQAELHGG